MRSTRLLVVLDETKASKRAVSYVAQIVERRGGFKVCLASTLPEIPASLIEYGGAKNPDEEEKLDADLHTEQKYWVVAAQEKAQPLLLVPLPFYVRKDWQRMLSRNGSAFQQMGVREPTKSSS